MNENLVNTLRGCASKPAPCNNCDLFTDDCCTDTLLRKAADVIAELSKYTENIKQLKCEGWYLQQTKYHDGYQAVATMPLPEPPKDE